MIIYHDIVTGDELFSDSYKYELVHDNCVYRVKGKYVTKENKEFDIVANVSEEEPIEDGAVGSAERVIDVVDSFKLNSLYYSKKDYEICINSYMKTVKGANLLKLKLEKEEEEKYIKKFDSAATKFENFVLDGDFKEWEFYTGESMDEGGMVVLRKNEGTTFNPYFYFFQYGLYEEKL